MKRVLSRPWTDSSRLQSLRSLKQIWTGALHGKISKHRGRECHVIASSLQGILFALTVVSSNSFFLRNSHLTRQKLSHLSTAPRLHREF